ncbi:pyridoxamine 5'-phosphate oxidase family protein [Mucilaginibacter sp.]|uniref:pyridoxamine 5'-phosphate oxidase family protein n=1 Tax=Mucilaginibacter sp. TaxID=1882438 RepID=UPI00260F51E3|nr:pyridoxamine 5'-phosphate oxidase family protein [Mucilaginibacter sp.]MDB4923403.1 Pyridoxamine 5-phosphate oxidase [Mucilaginibacter sp.]
MSSNPRLQALVCQFLKQHLLGVISTANKDNTPEAALVGIAVSEDLEIIFDTVKTSRKYHNILQNPQVALVIGWENEITVQYEGKATVLGDDEESESLKEIYFKAYPDGRERVETMPGLVHIKVTPRWLRYSNFNHPQIIEEIAF